MKQNAGLIFSVFVHPRSRNFGALQRTVRTFLRRFPVVHIMFHSEDIRCKVAETEYNIYERRVKMKADF